MPMILAHNKRKCRDCKNCCNSIGCVSGDMHMEEQSKGITAYHSYPMETSSEGFPELIVSLVGAELKPFIPLHTKA